MNKRAAHHLKTTLKPVKPYYFLAVSVVFLLFGLYQLRQNNLQSLRLRDKVAEVDKNNGDVEAALRDLRTFVYGHMNSGLASGPNAIKPPIQLKYRYERLVQAEKERVSKANENIYTQAQKVCEQSSPGTLSGRGRVPCIEAYVAERGTKEQPIQDGLYKFDFVAPFWSPDLAGWSLVLAALFFMLFAMRVSLDSWLKYSLKHRANL
jgi:hypothetical protein